MNVSSGVAHVSVTKDVVDDPDVGPTDGPVSVSKGTVRLTDVVDELPLKAGSEFRNVLAFVVKVLLTRIVNV